MVAADAAVALAASCQRTAVLRGTVTMCDEHLNTVTCDVICSASYNTHFTYVLLFGSLYE